MGLREQIQMGITLRKDSQNATDFSEFLALPLPLPLPLSLSLSRLLEKKIKPSEHVVVQEYVTRPYLMDGFKFVRHQD